MQRTRPAGTARQRLLDAALALFAEHGVSGTSLQMIADRLGVTKAAVYHQFQTKDDIVHAVIAPVMAELETTADTAERHSTAAARRQAALDGAIDLVIRHRRLAAILNTDPMVIALVRDHPAMEAQRRLQRLLIGTDPDDAARVRMSMLSGGLALAGMDPDLAGIDDDGLRRHLLAAARRLHPR